MSGRPAIVMTPAEGPTPSSNPRRVAAQRSVSLFHGKRPHGRSNSSGGSTSLNRATTGASNSGSPSSLQPLGQASSGESSNAQEWFEKSNNAVRDQDTSFNDESPFFMRHSSSSDTPQELQAQAQRMVSNNDGTQSLPFRAGMMHLGTDGSSTDDFRGVIDDLTIENKRLKKRLKRYERLHDSHLKDEKLFEVRIHGLPPDKKRELEETLRKFATNLGQQTQFPADGYQGLPPMLQPQKTTSSQTSLHNDSAYASMSTSGQGGSSGPSSETMHRSSGATAASHRQNIHSYLHQIPQGLLPQQNPATMTERAKKKMVVKRLEQLFAGRGAADTGHQQPQQQQEVSHMAARADRSALEASGGRARQEGLREAHIMSKDHADTRQESPDELLAAMKSQAATTGEQDFAGKSPAQTAIEQRPTRPLDLDLQRAQVPADNIAYFRNLGFSPPEPSSRETPEEGHGWLYLNLLINMAQLHTVNVTVEFVQKAISEYSDRFEMSEDGRKVRWKGRQQKKARRSSESGALSGERTSDPSDEQSPRKRIKLPQRPSMGRYASGATTTRSVAESNRYAYTPMFTHRESTDERSDSSSEADDTLSPFPMGMAGDSSGMTSSGVRTTSTRPKKIKDDGPIIFYNNNRFCTDLSAERGPDGVRNAPAYTTLAAQALGQPRSNQNTYAEKRGALYSSSELPEPMDLGDNPIPEAMEIDFPESESSIEGSEKQHTSRKDVNLEVTGMGGVWPADHFRISVQSCHARPERIATRDRSTLPPRFASILRDGKLKPPLCPVAQHQVLSTKTKTLPPAELPPALGFLPFMESEHDEDSDDEQEMSLSPNSPRAEPRSPAPQPLDVYPGDSDEEHEDDDEDDSDVESDTSVDFLAQARQLDPDSIRAQERAYDLEVAERLAEDIPAGSSAATAGGGSGFASPANDVERAEYRRAKQEARASAAAAAAALQRATAGDEVRLDMRS